MPPQPAQAEPVVAQRPTKEARQHGHYVAPESRGAVAVYTNLHSNVLGKLKGHGTITPRQHAAGLCFEETYTRVWGSASPSRDSTIASVGGEAHETQSQGERVAKARARLHTVLNRVGPQRYSLLVSVCVFGEGIGSNRGAGKGKALILRGLLQEALDVCADVYGLQHEAA